MLQVRISQIPLHPGVPAALLSLLQPEDLDTVVCPQGMLKAQAPVTAGDRLLMGLAGMSLSYLVHIFMLANESSLWLGNLISTCPFSEPHQSLIHSIALPCRVS